MTIALKSVPLPEFELPQECPVPGAAEYAERCDALCARLGLDWIGIYGDREHNANLLYFSGFDPRFEEGMLLLGADGTRAMLVGNEGVIHVVDAGLQMSHVLYQPFSLMGQPRGNSPDMGKLLQALGLRSGHRAGLVGWKWFEGDEDGGPAYVPAFLTRAIADVTGNAVKDVTGAVMNPEDGVRATVSAAEIARMEWGASRSSAAVLRVLKAARPGMTELDAITNARYAGEPLQCHMILAASDARLNGLRSPSARVLADGDAITCGIGYWGGLCCRAGMLSDAPDNEFFSDVVVPYFSAIAAWWQTIAIGRTGGEIVAAVDGALAGASFRPMLNPGHLGSYDEWVHSAMTAGSTIPLRSGMVLQCDIIPTPLPPGRALNCEDTVTLADEALRAQIEDEYPALWARIEARREFMSTCIGLTLAPEVLPLSHAPTWLPPFWLAPDMVCTVE